MRNGMILICLTSLLLGTVGNAIAADGDDLIVLAADHYAEQRWQLAAESFEAFLKENPQDTRTADALFYYAESLLQLGRYPEAAHKYQKFLDAATVDDQRSPDALFRMAEAAYLASRYHQAIERFAPFFKTAPQGNQKLLAEAYLAGALLAVSEETKKVDRTIDSKNLDQARDLFKNVIDNEPPEKLLATCQFGLARCCDLLGKAPVAQEKYTALLENPDQTIAAQAHYYLGRVANEQGNAKLAATTWEELIDQWPDTPWAREVYGDITHAHLVSDNVDQARRSMIRWQNVKDGGPTAGQIRHLARLAGEKGQTEWSLQLYAQLAAESKVSRPAAVQRLAAAQVEAGRVATAAETLEALLRDKTQDPGVAVAGLQLAEIYQQLENPKETLETYLLVAERWPATAAAQIALRHAAAIFAEQAKYEESASLYKKLLGTELTKSERAEAAYLLGWALQDAALPQQAKAQFETIYNDHLDSTYWSDATYRLADYAATEGDPEHARSLLSKLIAQEPNGELTPHALYLSGQLAVRQGQWKMACDPLAKLIKDFPNSTLSPPAAYWLAEAHYQATNYDDAERGFAALAKSSLPSDRAAFVTLRRGQLLGRNGEWKSAQETIAPLLADASLTLPEDELYYLLGRCQMADANLEGARVAFLRAAQRDQTEKTETAAMAQWMIGESLMHQERYAEAAAEYFRVVSLYPHPQWQAAALLQAARCYERRQQPQEAAQLYRQILKNYPDSDFASRARTQLKAVTSADRRPQS